MRTKIGSDNAPRTRDELRIRLCILSVSIGSKAVFRPKSFEISENNEKMQKKREKTRSPVRMRGIISVGFGRSKLAEKAIMSQRTKWLTAPGRPRALRHHTHSDQNRSQIFGTAPLFSTTTHSKSNTVKIRRIYTLNLSLLGKSRALFSDIYFPYSKW